jgi:hypothetical protein
MNPVELRDFIDKTFNDDELRGLCFELDIPYDDLGASTKSGKARELVAYCQRRTRLVELEAACRRLRPNTSEDGRTVSAESTSTAPTEGQAAGTGSSIRRRRSTRRPSSPAMDRPRQVSGQQREAWRIASMPHVAFTSLPSAGHTVAANYLQAQVRANCQTGLPGWMVLNLQEQTAHGCRYRDCTGGEFRELAPQIRTKPTIIRTSSSITISLNAVAPMRRLPYRCVVTLWEHGTNGCRNSRGRLIAQFNL